MKIEELRKRWEEANRVECFAEVVPGTADDALRTVDVIWYSGVDLYRNSWVEGAYMLRFDPKGADLSRLNAGAPVSNNHSLESVNDQLGRVVKAWSDGGKYYAKLQLKRSTELTGPRPEADGLWQDIKDKIVNKFSMGTEILASVDERDKTNKLQLRTATSWRPFEIAIAPLPADGQTQTLNRGEMNIQETTTTAAATATNTSGTETTLAGKLEVAAKYLNADAIQLLRTEVANKAISNVETLSQRIFDEMAKADAAQPQTRGHHGASITRDHSEGMVEAMSEALSCRYTGRKPGDRAQLHMGASVKDMARELCESRGIRVPRDAAGIIRLAHTTSDFPNLLQSTGERMLLEAYRATQSGLKQLARQSTANDFRTLSRLRLGEAPKLVKVNEHGEITYGTRAEAAESYKLLTYARLFGITREALINDDLGAFADFTRAYGVAASNLEAQVLVDLLYGGAGLGPDMEDSAPLFDASHGNVAGSGAAIGDTTLTAAQLAFRTTKGLDGETIIEVNPRYLLAPAAQETTAQKALAAIYPATTSTANVFTNALALVTDPRLDAKSTTRWWVFGDPAVAPVLEYAYLAGAPGPQVATRQGWEVLATEFRCVLDFGAGVIGFRGTFTNAGA